MQETTFLLPQSSPERTRLAQQFLCREFGGFTIAPGIYRGGYLSPTGEIVYDIHEQYSVAHPACDLTRLLSTFGIFAQLLDQESLYVNIRGNVYIIPAVRESEDCVA